MADKMITLPAADEMLARLRSVIDEPHAAANFYPKITKYAGQNKTVSGIEMMVALAIYDYAEGYPPAVATGLHVALPRFVRALCGTDDDALGDERS
jgi:hypothetical protein